MAKLYDVIAALDAELKTSEIPDYPGAHNGLQLENASGEVRKVATAVDATLPVIKKAVDAGANLLVVHHGIFWQGVQKIKGAYFEKLRLAMENDLAVYSSHIPLDIHQTLGNNAILAQKIAPDADWRSYFDWKGVLLGQRAYLSMSRGELAQKVSQATGLPLLAKIGKMNDLAGDTGVITGGAGGEIAAMIDLGIETFISGEAPHWAHGVTEEANKGLILGGHYATETFGVHALGEWLSESFDTQRVELQHSSGL